MRVIVAVAATRRADRAKCAALAWGSEGAADHSFVARGAGMATCSRTYARCIWVVNPVAETYRTETAREPAPGWTALPRGDRYFAQAYTTLDGHLLAGEERLAITRDGPDAVVAHILSVSRGNGFLGRLVFPFIGPMQRRFFTAQLDAIERSARS